MHLSYNLGVVGRQACSLWLADLILERYSLDFSVSYSVLTSRFSHIFYSLAKVTEMKILQLCVVIFSTRLHCIFPELPLTFPPTKAYNTPFIILYKDLEICYLGHVLLMSISYNTCSSFPSPSLCLHQEGSTLYINSQ